MKSEELLREFLRPWAKSYKPMTPQEQMMERITPKTVEMKGDNGMTIGYTVDWTGLAQVLVEMEEKISWLDPKQKHFDDARPMMTTSTLTPGYVSVTIQDPYLTALDDVEDGLKKLKRAADSSTYLYGQGESHALEESLEHIDDLRNKHKE